MNFYLPTKIYTEKNCVLNHSKELASYGKKAFIITGSTSSRVNGSLDDVITALTKESISYEIYDQVEENPSIETVMDAAAKGIKENIDFVIGIGGGSPLDAAKAIALMIRNPLEHSDILYQKKPFHSLPVIAIPTTAGTGSEATPYAILTLHSEQTKRSISHRIFPELALIDYSYLRTVPQTILINTAVDALGHLIESYINVNATDYSKMLCDYGFHLWGSVKHTLLTHPTNDRELECLMTASTIAGMAITHTGTSLPHGMSYSLTYADQIPHGKAVGIFLSSYLKESGDNESMNHIINLLGFSDYTVFDDFLHNLLGDVTISPSQVERDITGMMNNKLKLANCPYPVTAHVLDKIYSTSVVIK